MNAWDISFSSLSVGYGDHAVLHDINATLPGGKVSVILGGSGCGKSTLLRHIIGLSRPISGNLRIGGQDLFSLPHAEARRIRRRMGVLFQAGALLGALTLCVFPYVLPDLRKIFLALVLVSRVKKHLAL